jgi:septal ring factor EnvC (AmiA/AmiB activator)
MTTPTQLVIDIDPKEAEKRSGGTYNHEKTISQHVAALEESYERKKRENVGLANTLHAQRKQNEKMKEQILKMEKSLEEALSFIKKMKTWK